MEEIERVGEASPGAGALPDLHDQFSLAAMAALWDNEEDAIYDNWRKLYGVEGKIDADGNGSKSRPPEASPVRPRRSPPALLAEDLVTISEEPWTYVRART
jgi:hypothetical protein